MASLNVLLMISFELSKPLVVVSFDEYLNIAKKLKQENILKEVIGASWKFNSLTHFLIKILVTDLCCYISVISDTMENLPLNELFK